MNQHHSDSDMFDSSQIDSRQQEKQKQENKHRKDEEIVHKKLDGINRPST